MSLPVQVPDPAATPLPGDLFGFWRELAPSARPGSQSFAVGDEGVDEPAILVWRVDLSQGSDALDQRAQELAAFDQSLTEAEQRGAAFLAAYRQRAGGNGNQNRVSFSAEVPSSPLPLGEGGGAERIGEPAPGEGMALPPVNLATENDLLQALAQLDCPPGSVSFGLSDAIPWSDLQASLEGLLQSARRQLLNLAWVETSVDAQLAARTIVDWTGDMKTVELPDLPPAQLAAHRRSLEQAVTARLATLRTVTTVSQLAGSLILSLTNPISAVQAMALAWQFVRGITLPRLG